MDEARKGAIIAVCFMQAYSVNKAIEQKDITIRQLQKQLVRTHTSLHVIIP